LTPADANWVKDEWLRLENHYRDHGYSEHEAHVLISQEYKCCRMTVYRHLRKAHGRVGKKPKQIPYSEKIKKPGAKERIDKQSREGVRFFHHPEHYLESAFQRSNQETLTLEDISLQIQETYDFLPRLRTLESALQKLREKYGHPFLTEIPGAPPSYKLPK